MSRIRHIVTQGMRFEKRVRQAQQKEIRENPNVIDWNNTVKSAEIKCLEIMRRCLNVY